MGFYDNPTIDTASGNSDESELALALHFKQKHGFICRKINPDKGCDFDVELILDDKNASNWKFGIQLKSTTNPQIVKDGRYISYPFKTSRLGYLARQIPLAGLIVIYNVETRLCYYNWVADILATLYEEHGNGWEQRESVQVKIPTTNILNNDHLSLIHSKAVSLFNGAARLIDAFGSQYGLPSSFLKRDNEEYDFNNPSHIISFLKKYGIDLLIEYDINMVASLIDKLTDRQISSSTTILCLAAVVNASSGKFDFAEAQINKALRRPDITRDQRVLVQYEMIRSRYKSNKLTIKELIQQTEELKKEPLSEQSRLTIDVNLGKFRIGVLNTTEPLPPSLQNIIRGLFEQIERSGLSQRVKLLLTTWNTENFSDYINAVFIREAPLALFSGNPNEQIQFFRRIVSLNNEFLKQIEVFHQQQATPDNMLMRAYTLQIRVRHLLHLEVNMLNFKPAANNFSGFGGNIQELINQAFTAFNYFQQEGFGTDAYYSLCYALEFLEEARIKLDRTYYDDMDKLYSLKSEFERETGVQPYELLIPEIIEKVAFGGRTVQLKDLTQDQLDRITPMIAKAKGLPPEQAPNAVQEAIAYQMFYQRRENDNVELVSLYHNSPGNTPSYSGPVRYQLRNTISGIVSSPHYDVSYLMDNWGI